MNPLRILTLTGVALLVPHAFAQTRSTLKPAAPGTKWTLSRTPEGVPDLQGVYTNSSRVPLERPGALGSKEFYTKQEAEENERKGTLRGDRPATYSVVQYDLKQYGLQTGQEKVAPSLRTSLIMGPTGRIPPMLPEAQKRIAEKTRYSQEHQFDGPESRSLAERCILWPNEGPPMLPGGYNSNLQIVQSPGYVAILNETIHDVRMIPTVDRPQLPARVRQWRGESRGHWEGDTLVIETANFTQHTAFRGSGEHLRVVERLRRTSEDIVTYQFTVEDPQTWAEPWSGEVLLARIEAPIFEYACHEGNYGMPDILSGARATEKSADK